LREAPPADLPFSVVASSRTRSLARADYDLAPSGAAVAQRHSDRSFRCGLVPAGAILAGRPIPGDRTVVARRGQRSGCHRRRYSGCHWRRYSGGSHRFARRRVRCCLALLGSRSRLKCIRRLGNRSRSREHRQADGEGNQGASAQKTHPYYYPSRFSATRASGWLRVAAR
jgi:hypothetical protein